MVAITLEGISKSFGNIVVLDNITLNVPSGSICFFVGPSGCGKTTLLRIIAGLETAQSGKIYFDEREVTMLSGNHREIGFVFQQYCLWPHMTVAENISFGLEMQRVGKAEQEKKVIDVLTLVGLHGFQKRFPHELSGGQQQRVALARALVLRPKVLLMDEPLSNLDPALRSSIREELRKIVKEVGVTTIIVSHDPEDASSLADQVIHFDKNEKNA